MLAAAATGAEVHKIPMTDAGELDLERYAGLLGPRTRLVAVAHVSNTLGTVNPVADIVATAHALGVPVLVDGAQAVAHLPVDVGSIGCDLYAFSGHKLYGPTGIGVLYGREALLETLPPYQGGGDMIRRVTFEGTTFAPLPQRFEAGTPNVAGAIGLGAAIDYVTALGMAHIAAYEHRLLAYATEAVSTLRGVRLVGTAAHKASVLSFVMDSVHPHDIGTILDSEGVAIRAGHHCAMPLMDRYAVPATARASLGVYNTFEEVDALVRAIDKVKEIFG